MPEPRASRGRDFTAAPAIQVDSAERHLNTYERKMRGRRYAERDLAGADEPPARDPRGGYAIELRNGLPVHDYTYRGKGYDAMAKLLGPDYYEPGHWSFDIDWEVQRRA